MPEKNPREEDWIKTSFKPKFLFAFLLNKGNHSGYHNDEMKMSVNQEHWNTEKLPKIDQNKTAHSKSWDSRQSQWVQSS